MNGRYQVKVAAERSGQPVGSGSSFVRADASDAEYFNPTMHAQVLKRVADETGGRFYTADNANGLAEDVRYGGRGVTTVEERDLWHMPIVMVLMVGLMCVEWGYRRAAGLA